ncbi:MAG TPA: LPS assembly protein LptD [Opitutaceae bacterium]|nr:LPS assembly protein LptD [Opitutaceae bacterium]HOR24386.1 LPS assembly protein LptD [Opitutaceae bacterium]HPK49220.1 LPS assembly protein LptD [Opitutaceae bacterium]
MRHSRFLLPLLFTAAVQLSAALPTDKKIELTAPKQDYDLQTNDAVFSGGAFLRYGDAVLTADEIRYNTNTEQATAIGQAVLTMGERRLLADKITYNVASGAYTVEDLRVGQYPLYLQGASAEGTKEQLTIHDATVTFREPGPWAPALSAKSLTYNFDQRLRAEHARIGVQNAKFVSLPGFNQPVKDPFWSFLSLGAGFSNHLGAYLDLGARVPVAPGVKFGGDLSLYSKRGVLVGPAATYRRNTGTDQEVFGKVSSGYIHDSGDRDIDILGEAIDADRGFFSWQHHQSFNEHLTLDGLFNYWSDSEVLRDFRSDTFYETQTPDSYLEAAYTGTNYQVSLFSRVQPNTYHTVQERLPELRFDLFPFALPAGFYQRFESSAAILREDDPYGTAATLKSRRVDAYYALSRPFAPQEWLSITPIAGGRVTYYDRTTPGSGKDNYDRWLGELGVDAKLHASATYEYKNERWHIDGLRHLITPRLSYRYVPEAEDGRRFIPQIDRETFTTYLRPLGLGDTRNIDDLHATNTLRLGFDNTLQTRDGAYGSRDLAVLNLANDFRFDQRDGERDVSETHIELGVMPARWLQFDLYDTFAPQGLQHRSLSAGITVRDGDAWAVRLGTHFLSRVIDPEDEGIETYSLEARTRLNEVFSLYGRVTYDIRNERFDEQRYGIYHNLDNTWRMRYAVSIYNGRRRESHFGFNINIETIGF